MPHPSSPDLLRAAVRIRERLVRGPAPLPPLGLPTDDWQRLLRAAQRLSLAHRRGWQAATAHARDTCQRIVWLVMRRLEESLRAVEHAALPQRRLTLRELWDDLRALEQEFDEVRYDLRQQTLAVVTEAIVLDEVDLGRFEITLNWSGRESFLAYTVAALDPHPASSDSRIIHPHVRDGGLCEGEGRAPIRNALREGRLLDFFLLVRQILETYNPSSAYLALPRWHGSECHDCGDPSPPDDLTVCERCQAEVCPDCAASCRECGRECCGDCRQGCHDCDQLCCTACLRPCDQCHEKFCSECLTDGQCDRCREREEADEPEITPPAPPPAATPWPGAPF